MKILFTFATEEASTPPNPVLPVFWEFVWSAIFFFLLWILLQYVLLPPIREGRDARRAKAQASKDAASNVEGNLATLRADHEVKLSGARAEANRIMEGARAEADAERVTAVEAVDAEIVKLRASTAAEVDAARTSALAGARGEVDSLAVAAASKVLGRDLDAAAQQSILNQVMGQLT